MTPHLPLLLLFLLFLPLNVEGFLSLSRPFALRKGIKATASYHTRHRQSHVISNAAGMNVQIQTELDDEKISSLFAWVSRAFAGEEDYNNLMLAFAAVFGNLPNASVPMQMLANATAVAASFDDETEELCVGETFSADQRELASLGAMGAAQWTGQFRTRPHSLLVVKNFTHIEDWVKTLPRGCKRTIKRALQQNFTVTGKPIIGGQPAPHSSLSHFRCVVEHEVRLLANDNPYMFLDALSEAISRYMGTTRMAGEIREYRNATTGKVIAIAHEVRKGNTIRGQWFYATDDASKNYVWFHSVYDLVRRAIDCPKVDVVDLGPSGSDAFTDLKERYGFLSIDDWPMVANYAGPFWYEDNRKEDSTNLAAVAEARMKGQRRSFFW